MAKLTRTPLCAEVKNSFGIPVFSAPAGTTEYASIISPDKIDTTTLWVDGMGTFYVDELEADPNVWQLVSMHERKPRRVVAFPILKYRRFVLPDGRSTYNVPVELQVLQMSVLDFEKKLLPIFNSLSECGRSIMDFDIMITSTKQDRFVVRDYALVPAVDAKWKSMQNAQAFVQQRLNEYDSKIATTLATSCNVNTFIAGYLRKHPEYQDEYKAIVEGSGEQKPYAINEVSAVIEDAAYNLPPSFEPQALPVQAAPTPIGVIQHPQEGVSFDDLVATGVTGSNPKFNISSGDIAGIQ